MVATTEWGLRAMTSSNDPGWEVLMDRHFGMIGQWSGALEDIGNIGCCMISRSVGGS